MELILEYAKYKISKISPKGNCVVFDLDGTLITHDLYIKYNICEFYKYVSKLGFKIYIITARQPKSAVEEIMESLNLQYERIFANDLNLQNIFIFKKISREIILDNIVMCVGDCWWDFDQSICVPIIE